MRTKFLLESSTLMPPGASTDTGWSPYARWIGQDPVFLSIRTKSMLQASAKLRALCNLVLVVYLGRRVLVTSPRRELKTGVQFLTSNSANRYFFSRERCRGLQRIVIEHCPRGLDT
jgi:hypothetical protein